MPKPLAFSGKQNSELVTRGWKSYLHVSPAKPRMASVTWREVSQTGVIFWPARKQMWLYTRWDGIPAVNWDGDGHGLISVRARKELFACALSQCNRTHSMTGASQMERVCRCGLTAWSCTTFRRRQGRRPDVAEVVGFERASSRLLRPRPVARSLPSLGPLPLSQAVARSRPLAPRRFGEVPETIPLHLQRRGKRCKQRGLAEIVPYSSQIAAWQSHIYSSTVTAIRVIFNVIFGTMSRASKATRALARARLRAVVAKRREQKFHQLVMHGNYKQLRYSSFKKQFSWQRQLGYFFRSCFVFRCSFFGFSTGNKNEIKNGTSARPGHL